jgi:hypothetical protein
LCHGQQQGVALALPIVLHGLFGWLRRFEQRLDFAHRHAAIDPGEDALDPLHMLGIEQAMTLGGAVRHDQAVASLPGPQRDGIDAGLPGHFAYGKPALRQRFKRQRLGKVDAEVFAGA